MPPPPPDGHLEKGRPEEGYGDGEGEIREDDVLPMGEGPRLRVLWLVGQAGGPAEAAAAKPEPFVCQCGYERNRREAV